MSNYKQQISTQLNALGRAVPSLGDDEIYAGILDTCSGLVSVLRSNLSSVELDRDAVEELASCLDSLQSQMNGLATAAGNASCLTVSTDHVHRLETAVKEAAELTKKEQDAMNALPQLMQSNKLLEAQVQELEQRYTQQQTLNTSLHNKLEEFSEENRKTLEDKNTELLTTIAEKQQQFNALTNTQTEYTTKIASLDSDIANLPTEQQWVAEFDKKTAYLERLKKAKVECSPEKQNDLQNEIYELEKTVLKLESDMDVLKKRFNELMSAKTSIETEKGAFETDFIEKLQTAMDDLKNIMTSHKASLNKLKDDAEALKTSIDECDVVYRNYQFMFNTTRNPLEAIAKASSVEYANLKKYLDINVSDRITELKNNIDRDLKELGSIIDECREATALDQKVLHRKIFAEK